MRIRSRGTAWLVAGSLAILPVLAGAEEQSGTAPVVAKDVVARTVTLGSTSFRVTDRTRMMSAAGTRITLAELAVAESLDGAVALSGESMVVYRAGEGSRPELLELQVLGSVPR